MPLAHRSPYCAFVKRYDNRIAVVTGASSGIGRQLAVDLSQRGAVVIGLARRADLLSQLDAQLRAASPSSSTRTCDVADTDAFVAALGEVERSHGRIDILVNNAGIEEPSPATAGVGLDVYHRLFATNFFAVVAGTLEVVPGMVARRDGIVVNVSSDSARAPEAAAGAYTASKAALSAFTECIAHEVAPLGVHVHVLYPGWVPTAMGLAGTEENGLPPKPVRRTAAQVSALVLARMGGERIDINAARLPMVAPVARTLVPRLYQRGMRGRSRTRPSA